MKKNLSKIQNYNIQSAVKTFSFTKQLDVCCVNHVNIETEIVYVLDGQLKMNIENVTYVINKGQGIFVLPFETHDFSGLGSDTVILLFERESAPSFFKFLQNKTPITRIFPINTELVQYLDYALNQSTLKYSPLYAESVLAPILWQIEKNCIFKENKEIKNNLFLEALRIINQEFLYDISLPEVAEKIGCHHVTLSRVFNLSAGMSFSDYVNLRRCNYAQKLLRRTNLSVTEIALNSGFGSLRSFNRTFKKIFSISPREERKQAGVNKL